MEMPGSRDELRVLWPTHPWSPSSLHRDNRSFLISVNSFTAWSSSMFITWNDLQPGQLWIEADFSACNLNNQVSIIAPIPSAPMYVGLSKYKWHSPPARRGSFFLLQKSPTLRLWHSIPITPVTYGLWWIFLLLPLVFSRFEFSRKNLVSFLYCTLFFSHTHNPTQLCPCLWWWSTIRLLATKNLHHNMYYEFY